MPVPPQPLAGLLVALALGPWAEPAGAAVSTSLSWSGCTPGGAITRHRAYAADSHALTMSMLGSTDMNISGFEAQLMVASIGSGLGDAWRFDQDGCNSGAVTLALGSPAQACPSAFQAGAGNVSFVSFTYEPSRGTLRFGAAGPPRVLAAGRRYVLGELRFDLSRAVAGADAPADRCACGDRGTCIITTGVRFTNADGTVLQTSTWDFVSWASPFACDFPDLCNPDPCVVESTCVRAVVPARGATWGGIKNQYRMRSR